MGNNKKHKNNRLLVILMLVAIMICMLLSAGCQTKTAIREIQERGVLKVGTTGDYMPVSYLDPKTGEYVGFDIELAEDIADDLDVDLEYVKTSCRSTDLRCVLWKIREELMKNSPGKTCRMLH